MIKKTAFAICCTLLSFASAASPEDSSDRLNYETQKKFESKITELYQDYNLQGDFLIGLVDKSGLKYSHGINQALLNGKDSALNNDTPLYIASHTKSLTGTLLKILEEEGRVDLDRSIYDYLPNLLTSEKIDTKSIKVRQLLNHTAGFTSIMHSFKTAFLGWDKGKNELAQALNYKTLSAPPGKFRYSNTGPIIAAMIVEKVTGNSWQEEMKKRIFAPLKMHNTSSKVSDYPASEILPSIETNVDNKVFRSDFYKSDMTMHAAGGTISTINDMAKWLRFNIAQERSIIKKQDSFIELHQSTTAQSKTYFTYERHGYSLGWDVATYYGETILTRFGGMGGISFHASFMPSKNIGIVAFSNEERAYKLPHIAANYLYNLVLIKADVDTIFDNERKSFQKSYDNETKHALSNEMRLELSKPNDEMIGTYKNNDGWPEIMISKSADSYQLKWGLLSGPLMAPSGQEKSFLAALGPLNRKINVVQEGGVTKLTNGSLKYHKVN